MQVFSFFRDFVKLLLVSSVVSTMLIHSLLTIFKVIKPAMICVLNRHGNFEKWPQASKLMMICSLAYVFVAVTNIFKFPSQFFFNSPKKMSLPNNVLQHCHQVC